MWLWSSVDVGVAVRLVDIGGVVRLVGSNKAVLFTVLFSTHRVYGWYVRTAQARDGAAGLQTRHTNLPYITPCVTISSNKG